MGELAASSRAAMPDANGSSSSPLSDEEEEDISDDTLVDGISMASSNTTYISEGGDAYRYARGETFYSRDHNRLVDLRAVDDLIDIGCDNGLLACCSRSSGLSRISRGGR